METSCQYVNTMDPIYLDRQAHTHTPPSAHHGARVGVGMRVPGGVSLGLGSRRRECVAVGVFGGLVVAVVV